MTPFARMADRWNAVPAATSVAAALLLLIGLGVIYQNEQSYQATRTRETQIQAEILAASVSAALDFGDPAAAQESVDALRVNPQVRIAAVYDQEGQAFVGFARDGMQLPSAIGDGEQSGASVAAVVPVEAQGARVGTIRLEVAREPVSRRVGRYALVALFVIMAALVVVVLGLAHNVLRRTNSRLEASNRELTVQMEERAKAEEQLRQAQKMQALGQLTGGIAHDFNNLLTVIKGSADILQRPDLSDQKRTRFATAISETAARAASLTSQLLAFARRQPLQPKTIDLNSHVLSMIDLLDRTLGETIEIKTVLSQDVCLIEADPVQLESAILNIGVNARDAMPDGGRLTIRTAPAQTGAERGPAIELAIEDTGAGIEAEALSRIFEPFFTTKEVGRGTGLGLSQVYGFATQSGGDVRVESEPGKGTTVTLVLPCSSNVAAENPPQELGGAEHQGTGQILVVDDNEEVGIFAEMLLDELGYGVLRATSGEQALSLLDEAPIDCILTDVVMPGMDGIALAEAVRKRRPDLPIVLTTGFSEQIVREGARDLPVLFKPYSAESISAVLEKALAGNRREQPAQLD